MSHAAFFDAAAAWALSPGFNRVNPVDASSIDSAAALEANAADPNTDGRHCGAATVPARRWSPRAEMPDPMRNRRLVPAAAYDTARRAHRSAAPELDGRRPIASEPQLSTWGESEAS
ncbi:MAG: hypothetical protein JNK12_05290 [Acidimicrobiales bacterium]|nr:hypothetical protein [Acidimicrobiales bacterium]